MATCVSTLPFVTLDTNTATLPSPTLGIPAAANAPVALMAVTVPNPADVTALLVVNFMLGFK